MATLVVIAYDREEAAAEARTRIFQLQKQELVGLDDAVVVVRRANGKAKIDQAVNLTGAKALSGAFWGSLIGLIFLAPALGAVVGAAAGGLSGKMLDLGINDRFIKESSEAIAPGTSALFLLVHRATPDKVIADLRQFGGTIIQTNLSDEDEAQLIEAFTTS